MLYSPYSLNLLSVLDTMVGGFSQEKIQPEGAGDVHTTTAHRNTRNGLEEAVDITGE